MKNTGWLKIFKLKKYSKQTNVICYHFDVILMLKATRQNDVKMTTNNNQFVCWSVSY